METTIEDAFRLISYPPKFPNYFPTQSKLLDGFYKLKIFTLPTCLLKYCVDNKEVAKVLALPTQEHLTVLVHEFSTLVLPTPFKTCTQLLQEIPEPSIAIHCNSINTLLNGGLRIRHLTEISGESGSGKSQIALQYLLNVQLPPEHGGLNGNCVYVTTESEFGEKRLEQMSKPILDAKIKGFERFKDISDNILVNSASTLADLENIFFHSLPKVLESNGNIRLVVLDSVASIYRSEFGINDSIKRSDSLFKLAAQMKFLCYTFDFAMLVVNQVTAVISDDVFAEKLQPSLGLSWSSCVDTRLMCKKKSQSYPVTRGLKVIFSSYLASDTEAEYVIENEGIKDLLE